MKVAATLICVRSDSAVLMVERRSSSRAFAGAMVFPGGIEEAADSAHAGVSAARVCALREAFEEAGLVLGEPVRRLDRALRSECSKDAAALRRVYSEEQLKEAAARLKEWSRWTTPQQEKHRYDTRFFAVRLTDEEARLVEHDNDEVVSSRFAKPEEFLELHGMGKIFLVPPTWVTLCELRDLKQDMWNSRRSMTEIEPTLLKSTEELVVALPGDLAHYKSPPSATGMRRILIVPGKPYQWIDTVANSKLPTSSL